MACQTESLLLLSEDGTTMVNVAGKTLIVVEHEDQWRVVVADTDTDWNWCLAEANTRDDAIRVLARLSEFLGAIPAGAWMQGRPPQYYVVQRPELRPNVQSTWPPQDLRYQQTPQQPPPYPYR